MIGTNNPFHRLLRLRRSTLFRSPAHLLPATSVLLVVLLAIISFFLPASGSSLKTSSGYQLNLALRSVYDTLGIPYDDEFGLKSESDTVSIDEGDAGNNRNTQTRTVIKGESIYSILTASGLTHQEAHEFSRKLNGQFSIRDFRAGKSYDIETTANGSFSSLSLRQNQTSVLHLEKDEQTGELSVWKETLQPETRTATLQGTINSSLADALRLQGRPSLAKAISEIFSSKIDLARKAARGATYRILYEEQWIDKEFAGTGKILAVEIINGNGRYQAYRFTDTRGSSAYFDEQGRPLQNGHLMIEPCNYERISSTFGYRVHPIRRTLHFHGGVDFAAPLGTPVRAAADGRVIFRGWKGGAGNMITIVHGGGMHTQYLHLSRFSSLGVFGRSVRQGDIIGYVGSTGSSTGAHLDFRVIMNGKPKDPLVALRSNAPQRHLSPAELGGLLARIDFYQAQFERRQINVASVSERPSVIL